MSEWPEPHAVKRVVLSGLYLQMYFKLLQELRGIIDKHALADKSLLT